MNSIFAEIHVPALDLTMDLLIPVHVTARQAIALIVDIVNKKEKVALEPGGLLLYDLEQQAFLCRETAFDLLPVQDACKLVVI